MLYCILTISNKNCFPIFIDVKFVFFFFKNDNTCYISKNSKVLNILFFISLGLFWDDFTCLSLDEETILYIVGCIHSFSPEFEKNPLSINSKSFIIIIIFYFHSIKPFSSYIYRVVYLILMLFFL